MSARKHYRTVEDAHGEHIVSPGEILTKELRRQKITQKELAVMLGRSEKFVSQLITGKVRLTYDVAYDLERALKVPTSRWNAAEAAFQDVLTREARLKELDGDEISLWVDTFPYDAMVDEGLVPPADTQALRARNILDFFCVASPRCYDACVAHSGGLKSFRERKEQVDGLR